MKVKFINPDGSERIEEVPEDVKQLNITLELPTRVSAWPSAVVLSTIVICFTAVIWMFTRG